MFWLGWLTSSLIIIKLQAKGKGNIFIELRQGFYDCVVYGSRRI